MKRLSIRVLSTAAIVSALTACASTPATPADTTPVPADRRYWKAPANASATIVVLGDAGRAWQIGATRELVLDGMVVARIDRSERIDLFVVPGEHVLGVRTPANIVDSTMKTAVVMAEIGKTYIFGIATDGAGNVTLNRSMPSATSSQ